MIAPNSVYCRLGEESPNTTKEAVDNVDQRIRVREDKCNRDYTAERRAR